MTDLIKKIILFGFTNAAIEIGFHLREKGYDFTIIDDDPSFMDKAEEYGFDLRIFDYTDDDLLQKAGIGEKVDLIFSLFLEDSKNIFLAISARALDDKLNIVSITQSHDSIHKLRAAGADSIIDPYQISGKKIYEVIKKPEIVSIIDDTVFGREDINIEQIEITKGSKLDGVFLDDVPLAGVYNIIILGIHDKEIKERFTFITEGMRHKLDEKDVLVVIGEEAEIERFKNDYAV